MTKRKKGNSKQSQESDLHLVGRGLGVMSSPLLDLSFKDQIKRDTVYISPRFYPQGKKRKDCSHLSNTRHIKHRPVKLLDEK